MPKTKSSVQRHQRKRRTMKRAKGMVGGRSKLYRTAKESVRRAGAFAWRDRRARKRDFRRLWITRINAACRQRGLNYSRFMAGLSKADVRLNRKMLSEIAIHDPAAFDKLVEQAQKALAA